MDVSEKANDRVPSVFRKLASGRARLKPGDSVLEINPGEVLWHSQARRRLLLCRCVDWEWECETLDDGTTLCKQVCIAWSCKETPPKFTI